MQKKEQKDGRERQARKRRSKGQIGRAKGNEIVSLDPNIDIISVFVIVR
jgi:hypothetical protein